MIDILIMEKSVSDGGFFYSRLLSFDLAWLLSGAKAQQQKDNRSLSVVEMSGVAEQCPFGSAQGPETQCRHDYM